MLNKLRLSIMLIVCLVFYSCVYALNEIVYDGVTHEYNVRDVSLILNGDKFEPKQGQMPPIILNDRTLVPVREVFEYLDGKVDWDGTERRVDISFDDNKITLWIDKLEAKVNDKTISLDVPAKIINDKTMVPARFISENAGFKVSWDAETYTVDIRFPKVNITKIGFANINGTNCLVAYADGKIMGYKYFSLPKEEDKPLRLVLDIENCSFKFNTETAKFESGAISEIRFGNQGNDVNRIVLDFRDDTDYVVTLSKDRKTLYYAMAEEFKLEDDEINNDTKEDNKPVTVPSGERSDEQEIVDSSGDTKNDVTPIKNEVNYQTSGDATLDKNIDSGDTNIDISNSSGDNVIVVSSGEGENIVVDDLTLTDDHSDEESNEEVDYETLITSIKYSASSKRVKIKYTGKIKYSDSIITNPNRVILDIEDAKLDTTGPTEIEVKNSIITSVRFSQYTKTTVRIVLDIDVRGNYRIYKKSSELQVEVEEATYQNIKYKKNKSNSQITLIGVDMSDIRYEHEKSKNKFTLESVNKKTDFGYGTLEVDDELVRNIKTDKNEVEIIDTGNLNYSLRQSSTNVIITLRKNEENDTNEVQEIKSEPEDKEVEVEKPKTTVKKTKGNKTILIDVGHGGKDPGACNGDAQEKVYNLNIALYLYDMLKSRDDINVFIDREDNDTYLNREDRVAYAENIAPDFIVSIHNNSVENKSYTGTMVLYYNNDSESDYGDITSSECAEIILKELIKNLETVNRGIVNRGDLHILSKTSCPSVLCEVCFVSNDAELERLKTKSFQKLAAEAIYNGIDKILKEF